MVSLDEIHSFVSRHSSSRMKNCRSWKDLIFSKITFGQDTEEAEE
jgi:hypothetical protein